MNYPWKNKLWVYARAQNFNIENCALQTCTRQRTGLFEFLTSTKQQSSTNSDNPLLIVQTVGKPSKESERIVQTATIQSGGGLEETST